MRHLKSSILVMGIMALMLPTSPPASAGVHVKEGSGEIGIQLGGYLFLDDEADRKHTFNYRAYGTYNFWDILGAEFAFGMAPKEVNRDTLLNVHLDVIVHPLQHAWAVPFVGAGPTFSIILPEDGDTDADPGANVIVGVKLYPWEQVGFRVDGRYIVRFGTGTDEDTSHDLIVSAGLFMTLGGADDDAVLLDTDGDGILDADDKCPTVAGVESAAGCPDEDGDTVADADDQCPKLAGTPELDGCPDQDGDGLVDPKDQCPKIAGPEKYEGCPDTDGDTLADHVDRCPEIPGELAYDGCPPPPPVEVVAKFSGRIKGITFKFDSDEITTKSYRTLDKAVAVMKKYVHLRVRIDGHTSSEGTAEYNQDLSERRAASVKRYLVEKGVADYRVETQGFGKSQPVADETSEKARRLNRRIEFTLLRK